MLHAVAVRGDRADLGDFLVDDGRLPMFFSSPTAAFDGLVDAALQVHRVHAGGDRLHALADERLRQHGGGGGAVAGVVGGLGGDLFTICAPMFSNASASSFLGDGETPSLVMVRCAVALLQHDVAALRTGVALTALASTMTPAHHLERASSPKRNVALAAIAITSMKFTVDGNALEATRDQPGDREQVVFLHHQQLDAVQLHFGAAVLAEQGPCRRP